MEQSVRSRRDQALDLADDLLSDFELNRLPPRQLVLKASRLARLLDDHAASAWLRYEIVGYVGKTGGLDADAWAATARSGRRIHEDSGEKAFTSSVSELQAIVEAKRAQLGAASDAPVSVTSANPNQFVSASGGNRDERNAAARAMTEAQSRLDRVMGSVFEYVRDQHFQLRFGSAVETAVELVRRDVDDRIADLAPEAAGKLTAAYENASSDNPEHWASAAGTCRRLLKAVADAVRPPGPDVDGRKMGPENYVNRLVAWICDSDMGGTLRDVVTSDLALMGERIDAFTGGGHKGAHAEIDQLEAARILTGTYLLLADLLTLSGRSALGGDDASAGASSPRVADGLQSVADSRDAWT